MSFIHDLLRLLQQNARQSVSDLARQLGASEADVKVALANLEENGTIVQYTVILNEEKEPTFHDKVRGIIEVRVRPEKQSGFEAIAHRICRHSEVVAHYLVSGRYDFLLVVEGNALKDIAAFVSDKLAPIENIQSTTTNFILRKYKENGVMISEGPDVVRNAIQP
jgi:DNA-binding Lrp family transcriptional regulator